MKIMYETAKHHPIKQHKTDAAWDLCALEETIVPARGWSMVHTGLRMGIPEGYAGLVMSRSGLASRGIFVLNAPGVIDAEYSGEIKVVLANMMEKNSYNITAGDRIAQLMIVRVENIYLSPGMVWGGDRGSNGFGSTGN